MLGCLRSSGLLRRALPAQHVRGAPHSFQVSGYTTSVNELTTVKVCVSNAASARHGAVLPVLQAFDKHGLSLTHMESRLHQYSFGGVMLEFDFEGSVEDEVTQQCLRELTELPFVSQVSHTAPRSVPWFPTSLRDLDEARETLDGGTALINEDHPGFHDEVYKKRRSFIVENARSHSFGKPIPVVDYTEQEHETWRTVYDRLQAMQSEHACEDFQRAMAKFNRHGVLTRSRIPQLEEVNELLHAQTGFQIRPVQGLLTARDFLNALAFRVFWSTQYIRHHSNPFYTPEPDICHELLGHVPLFAHPDFADFSQTIGLASLGATDAQIEQLATLYWFTVEFGLLNTEAGFKAYGAGLLSSFGELEWACAPRPSSECRQMGGLQAYERFKDLERPEVKPLEAAVACATAFPITTYQPLYFCSSTLADAKEEVLKFCDTLSRPFLARYDPFSQRIKVTRSVHRLDPTTTAAAQAAKQFDYFQSLLKADAPGIA